MKGTLHKRFLHVSIFLMILLIFGWAWAAEAIVIQTAQISTLETNPDKLL